MAKVEGLERLKARFAKIPKEIRKQVRVAIDKSANELVAFQRRLVDVDKGVLRDSIRIEPGRHDLSVVVTAGGPTTTKPVRDGADASYDYALANEFGTKNMPAQPFFYSPYRANRRRIKSRISRAVKKAVKGNG